VSPRVTIVSTGAMGQAFCRALRARDVSVAAWNRTAARARPLARLGVAVFEDLAPALDLRDIESSHRVDIEVSGCIGTAERVPPLLFGLSAAPCARAVFRNRIPGLHGLIRLR